TDTVSILDTVNLVLTDTQVYEKMHKAKNPLGDGTAGRKIVKILKNLEEKDRLKIKASDFTQGFWKREFIDVDSKLDGKRVGELDFVVIKVIEDGKERFPSQNMALRKGQMIEIIK
ncbi:MAG: hypothetical protein ACE5HY_00695, partial [Candidatus Hydrothermarchaeales archaeon]